MKDLEDIPAAGPGLPGGSIPLAVPQRRPGICVVGCRHRASTRRKARDLGVATQAADELSKPRAAFSNNERQAIRQLLESARSKRAALVRYKIMKKERLS